MITKHLWETMLLCVPGESGPLSCSIRLQSLSSSAESDGLTENSDMRKEWNGNVASQAGTGLPRAVRGRTASSPVTKHRADSKTALGKRTIALVFNLG